MSLGRRVLIRNAALLAAAGGCARRIEPAAEVGGALDAAGRITIAPGAAPQLAQPGGAVAVQLTFDGAPQRFGVLVANLGTQLRAFDRDCPHASCALTWVAEDREVECPCHGSRFASDGLVLHPPAVTNIGVYPVETLADDSIVVHFFPADGTYPAPDAARKLTLRLSDYPALAQAGGAVFGFVEGPPGPLLVVRVSDGQIAAMNARCTHQACIVRANADSRLHCPCHGSEYQLDGTLLAPPIGPATFPLQRFATTLSADSLLIELASPL